MTVALAREFDRCGQWLAAALARDPDVTRSLADVRREVLAGRAQLWPGERSAMVTQVLKRGARLCIHVWLGGGDLGELMAMRTGAEAWGRAMGCDAATIEGRTGWARVLRRYGWAWSGEDLRKDL